MVARRRLEVGEDGADQRADKWVSQQLQLSRRRVMRLMKKGRVTCGPRRIDKSEPLRPGMQLEVELEPEEARPDPGAALDVRYEDEHQLVVFKQSAQPTVPLDGEELGTLANALVGRYPECAGVGYSPLEPGLLHRLDTGTSGLLLAARSAEAFASLKEALGEGRIQKRYMALVRGELRRPRLMERRLAPHPRSKRRVVVLREGQHAAGSYRARTEILPRGTSGEISLVELLVCRAYRHQIRAHLAALGHPILGDEVYGDGGGATRLALHASHIAWAGGGCIPLSSFSVAAPLPSELVSLLPRDLREGFC